MFQVNRNELIELKAPSSLTNAPATTGITNSQVGDPTTAVTSGNDAQGRKVSYTSTTTHYHASATYDTNVLLNPGTNVIYPGSVILGQTIDDGTYQEVFAGAKKRRDEDRWLYQHTILRYQ